MKVTIIPSDNAVYKDEYCFNNLILTGVPEDVHALQFNTTSNAGWIEFKDDDFGNKPNNQPITALPAWANDCLTKWDEAKVAEEAAIEAARVAAQNQPATQGTQTL